MEKKDSQTISVEVKDNKIMIKENIDLPTLAKLVAKYLKIETQDPLSPEKRIHFRKEIPTGFFLWYIFTFIGFLYPQGLIKLGDWTDAGWWCCILLIIGGLCVTIQWSSAEKLTAFGMRLMTTILDPKLDEESKLSFVEREINKNLSLDPDKIKYKPQLRDNIPVGFFICYVGAIILIIQLAFDVIKWGDLNNPWFVGICWLMGWGSILIFGWEQKGSLYFASMNLLRIIHNPKIEPMSKLAYIKEMIEKLIGFAGILETEVNQSKEHTGMSQFIIPEGRCSPFPDTKKVENESPFSDIKSPLEVIKNTINTIEQLTKEDSVPVDLTKMPPISNIKLPPSP